MRTIHLAEIFLFLGATCLGQPPVTPPHLPPHPPRPVPARLPQARLARVSLEAEIRDGAARTEVRAAFTNPYRTPAEAFWLVPLPPGAVVHQAKLLLDGKEVKAQILDAEKARRAYQEIVARLLDPMLLEYAGWGLVRARIYPVPPGGKAEVRFSMTALLPREGAQWSYVFPFKALVRKSTRPPVLSARLRILSSKALGVVYSPTPKAEIRRTGETEAVLGWESKASRPADLKLFYSLAEKEFGALTLFYSPQGGSGTFLFALNPVRDPRESAPLPKTVVFAVDTSGSMQGRKIEQVKGALRFFLRSLEEKDAFNLVPFSTAARPLFPEPKPVTAETRKEALEMVNRLEAEGGTNIEDALTQGLKMPPDGRKHILLFLTDGLPTVGETDPAAILKAVKKSKGKDTRIFVFGVGNDVNTFLLDRIAEMGRGDRHYVGENENIEVKVSSLLQRLSRPALSDLEITMEGARLSKLTPWPLPDLFYGSPLTVLGRFEGKGRHDLVLRGTLLGRKKEWRFPVTLPERPEKGLSWLAPLWAQRRIAHLLDQIRLYGASKELQEEVTRLGKRYGIVTPWTSYLVAQEARRLAGETALPVPPAPRTPETDGRRGRGISRGFSGPPLPNSPSLGALSKAPSNQGKRAVEESKELARMKTQDAADVDGGGGPLKVRRAGGKVFILLGDVWVDRAFKKEMKGKIQKIRPFSPAYFELLEKHPEAGPWLAAEGKILVVIGDTPYLIG